MEQYIPKSAVVAEIEKWISGWTERLSTNPSNPSFYEGGIEVGKHILFFIDSLEVKEVDLNEYINKYFKGWYVDLTDQGNILHTPDGNAGLMSVKEVAKHFFELGLKAQKNNIRHSMDETPKYPCDILLITNVDNVFLYRYMENGRPVDRETPYFHNILNGKCWCYCSDVVNE